MKKKSESKKSSKLKMIKNGEREFPTKELLTNYVTDTYPDGEGGEREVQKPRDISEVFKSLMETTGDWPKAQQGELFFCMDGELVFMKNTSSLFAYLQKHTQLDWSTKKDMVTKAEFFEFCKIECENIEYATRIPHSKPLPGVFYTKQWKPKYTGKLGEYLDMLKPASEHDRQLLHAMFLTPFWAGPHGQRPAFIIVGPDNDPRGGRGVGKSEVTQRLAELCGGAIEFQRDVSSEHFFRGLINSPTRRIIRFDNVKGAAIKSGVVEGTITTPEIVGHKLNHGTISRPNVYTFLFTFNDASLSEDMAQRSVVIQLDRPNDADRAEFSRKTDVLFERYKDAMIEDILYTLVNGSQRPLKPGLRFQRWGEEVLSIVADESIVDHIMASQSERNDEEDRATEFEEHIGEILLDLPYPGFKSGSVENLLFKQDTTVFISSKSFRKMVADFVGRKDVSSNYATIIAKSLGGSWIVRSRTNTKRGFSVCLSGSEPKHPAEAQYFVKGDEYEVSRL